MITLRCVQMATMGGMIQGLHVLLVAGVLYF
jgi:hypothetical protein